MRIIMFLMFIIFLLLLVSCSPRARLIVKSEYYHDAQHPCTKGQYYYSKRECENWQKKYPHLYARYKKRIASYEAAGLKLISESAP
jgi:hypothetical protein